jgi:uncharacterized membrane protein (UPF0127 family)
MKRRNITAPWTVAAAAVLALLAAAAPAARGDAVRPLSAFPRERLAIETRSARRHLFEAWRADTPQTRAQGLMFVSELRADRAMIFVYDPPQRAGMWMKNTLIPLDMLFVDDGGCVVKIHPRALPGDLTGIAADVPVVLVVELAGGTAASLGLSQGDRVMRPDAGWPRESRPCTAPR